MPIDPSVYAKLGQNQGANLFGPFAEFAYGNEALSQNRLLMQTYAAKQGIGQAIKMHTDADGNVDWGAAVGTAAAQGNPMAAEFRNQVLTGNFTDQETLGVSLDNYKKQTAAIAGAAYAAAQGMTGSNPNAPADTKALMSNVADLLHVTGANGEQLFPSATLIPHIANIVGQYKTNGQLKAGLMQIAQNGMTASERIQNLQTEPGLYRGAAGQPLPGQVNVMGGAAAPLQNAQAGGQAAPAVQTGTTPAPAAPAASAPTLGGLSPVREAQLKGVGEAYNTLQNKTMPAMQTQMMQLQELKSLLKQYPNLTGGGATFREEMTRVGQAFGIPQDKLDDIINRGAANEFQKLALQNATSTMTGLLPGGSRLNMPEFQAGLKANVNLDTDPRSVDRIFRFLQQVYNIKSQELDEFNKWTSRNLDPVKFAPMWNQHLIAGGVTSSLRDTLTNGIPASALQKAENQ